MCRGHSLESILTMYVGLSKIISHESFSSGRSERFTKFLSSGAHDCKALICSRCCPSNSRFKLQ